MVIRAGPRWAPHPYKGECRVATRLLRLEKQLCSVIMFHGVLTGTNSNTSGIKTKPQFPHNSPKFPIITHNSPIIPHNSP